MYILSVYLFSLGYYLQIKRLLISTLQSRNKKNRIPSIRGKAGEKTQWKTDSEKIE